MSYSKHYPAPWGPSTPIPEYHNHVVKVEDFDLPEIIRKKSGKAKRIVVRVFDTEGNEYELCFTPSDFLFIAGHALKEIGKIG